MLKASALYLVIVLALVIGIICSALIVGAYFYRSEYQKKFRYDLLENNLESGINLLLTGKNTDYDQEKAMSLFNAGNDSVMLKHLSWGVFDIGVVKSFIQHDTLYRAFSMADQVDSSKWAALYIIDEDRPLSVSGNTMIKGDAYLPKAGIKEAYVDNKAYEGDKRLVIGHQHTSEKQLPGLDATRIGYLQQQLDRVDTSSTAKPGIDSIHHSFLKNTKIISLGKKTANLENMRLSGNVIIYCDTTLTIDSTVSLNQVMVFARSIAVKSGFHGSCQLFAVDSVSLGNRCVLSYPSCIGIVRSATPKYRLPEKINVGDHSIIEGIILTYEKEKNELKPYISMGKEVKVMGQIYSQGLLGFKDAAEVDGSVFTSRFIYKSSYTLYENYLINIRLDSKALSHYYLTSDLLPVAAKTPKKTLQWLEPN